MLNIAMLSGRGAQGSQLFNHMHVSCVMVLRLAGGRGGACAPYAPHWIRPCIVMAGINV